MNMTIAAGQTWKAVNPEAIGPIVLVLSVDEADGRVTYKETDKAGVITSTSRFFTQNYERTSVGQALKKSNHSNISDEEFYDIDSNMENTVLGELSARIDTLNGDIERLHNDAAKARGAMFKAEAAMQGAVILRDQYQRVLDGMDSTFVLVGPVPDKPVHN